MVPNMATVLSIALINKRAEIAKVVKDISIALELPKIAVKYHQPSIACCLNYAYAGM